MSMRLVERMIESPNHCGICGRGNTPDGDTHVIGPFIDTGVQFSWGETLYICLDCGTRIGALSGMGSPDDLQDRDQEIATLKRQLHEARADSEFQRARDVAQIASQRAAAAASTAPRTSKAPIAS